MDFQNSNVPTLDRLRGDLVPREAHIHLHNSSNNSNSINTKTTTGMTNTTMATARSMAPLNKT